MRRTRKSGSRFTKSGAISHSSENTSCQLGERPEAKMKRTQYSAIRVTAATGKKASSASVHVCLLPPLANPLQARSLSDPELFLLQWPEAPVSVADADQRAAEPEERQGTQYALELSHVGQEHLSGDQTDAGERGAAQPLILAEQADRQEQAGESQPDRRIGIPLGIADAAPGQALALEG